MKVYLVMIIHHRLFCDSMCKNITNWNSSGTYYETNKIVSSKSKAEQWTLHYKDVLPDNHSCYYYIMEVQ